MKVTLLGTGTPTNPGRFQSAVLAEYLTASILPSSGQVGVIAAEAGAK